MSQTAGDVQLVGDGGGKAPQFARAIVGAEKVARVLASTFPCIGVPDDLDHARGCRRGGHDEARHWEVPGPV